MRLGVLDIGSNTGHLLVVDAHRGAAPLPAYSFKRPLRLAEHLDEDGALAESGTRALVGFVAEALEVAENKGCQDVLGFATSAVRDATNSDAVLDRVKQEAGVDLAVLPGDDEARLTFLAVRRWFGWSSGRLAVFDIGGGSLEIAAGDDEVPSIARSLPLGAGRLTRTWLPADPPDPESLRALKRTIRTELASHAGTVLRGGAPDHAVATSKTFRSLARICGVAPAAEGPMTRRVLERTTLTDKLAELVTMDDAKRRELPGVSPDRSHQLVAGALVADAVMDIFEVPELQICPWALREGIILQRLDVMSFIG